MDVSDLRIGLTHRSRSAPPITDGFSLALRRGEICGIVGESGSGKTMVCRAVTGALPSGVGLAHGVVRLPPGGSVAAIFADPHASLDPLQRVGGQIAEVGRVCAGLSRRDAKSEALRLLTAMSLTPARRIYRLFPHQLSGGMAQRVMIASALASRPSVLVADEPTSALDATVSLEVLDLLKELVTAEHLGIVLTTHDMRVVARICSTVIVMYGGRICETGTVVEVLTRPRHPYTKLLLGAQPSGTRGTRLATIGGGPLTVSDRSRPCPFSPRCPRRESICDVERPPLAAVGAAHAACHFPVEER